jgi:hypothetical protein
VIAMTMSAIPTPSAMTGQMTNGMRAGFKGGPGERLCRQSIL